jgi:hypothetical protein
MLSPAQRDARATRIGASEVAALPLIDAHPFTTPERIFDRLVYGISAEVTPRMQVGQLLEPAVLSLARRLLGLPLVGCGRPYVHPELPLCASPDAYAGPGALAEVKVTGAWSDRLPDYVRWQAMTQLLLTGRRLCYVVVLSGSELTYQTVEADPDAFALIGAAVRDYRDRYLIPGIRPEPKPLVFTSR